MLGDQVGAFNGQSVSTRVLADEGLGPRMEVTDRQMGTLCGVPTGVTVTYVSTLRPNGTLAGEGTGIAMTESGGAATFRGSGVGTFGAAGATSWRGALIFETADSALSGLNGIAVVFEYEVDGDGKSEGRLYEWK